MRIILEGPCCKHGKEPMRWIQNRLGQIDNNCACRCRDLRGLHRRTNHIEEG